MDKNIKIKKILCLDVLIIGCGNIAGNLKKKPSEKRSLITQAVAFSKDSRFKIKVIYSLKVFLKRLFKN